MAVLQILNEFVTQRYMYLYCFALFPEKANGYNQMNRKLFAVGRKVVRVTEDSTHALFSFPGRQESEISSKKKIPISDNVAQNHEWKPLVCGILH